MSAAKMAAAPSHKFTLPPLPFKKSALAPAISEATLTEHHDFHHKKYIDETNKLVAGSDYASLTLAELVRAVAKDKAAAKLFNNASQAWNHAFYWKGLSPTATKPSGQLAELVETAFGSLDAFTEKLATEATGHFGSGWAWLVKQGDTLAIVTTHDAGSPLTMPDIVPLLVVDVWEHAYYLDYQHDRAAHLKAVTGKHLNWAFAAEALAAKGDLDLGVE